MNREEILEKSRNENKRQSDERTRSIQTKANSISQCVGLAMCFVLGYAGASLSGNAAIFWCGVSIYWSMLACERLMCAIAQKNKGQWLLAGVCIVGCVAIITVYLLMLTGRIAGNW